MSKLIEEEIIDLAGLVRYSIMYKDYKDLDIEKLCIALTGAVDLYIKEKEKHKSTIYNFELAVDKLENSISKDKIKEQIQVFKKEGSQTSLIIASVLEDLLKEN